MTVEEARAAVFDALTGRDEEWCTADEIAAVDALIEAVRAEEHALRVEAAHLVINYDEAGGLPIERVAALQHSIEALRTLLDPPVTA